MVALIILLVLIVALGFVIYDRCFKGMAHFGDSPAQKAQREALNPPKKKVTVSEMILCYIALVLVGKFLKK